jgi:hypothetical protein
MLILPIRPRVILSISDGIGEGGGGSNLSRIVAPKATATDLQTFLNAANSGDPHGLFALRDILIGRGDQRARTVIRSIRSKALVATAMRDDRGWFALRDLVLIGRNQAALRALEKAPSSRPLAALMWEAYQQAYDNDENSLPYYFLFGSARNLTKQPQAEMSFDELLQEAETNPLARSFVYELAIVHQHPQSLAWLKEKI